MIGMQSYTLQSCTWIGRSTTHAFAACRWACVGYESLFFLVFFLLALLAMTYKKYVSR